MREPRSYAVALGRLVAVQTALPPKLLEAMTLACTPQMSAAIPIGTWTVLPTIATLIRPCCWELPPPPPPPVAVERAADVQRALPPKLPDAITLACTPQTSAATATGTWTVLPVRS